MRKWWLPFTPFLLAACAALTGCRGNGTVAAGTKKQADRPAVAVKVKPAFRATMDELENVTGSLSALHDVVVGVKSPGTLVAVYFREGDHVKAGQVVAQQDVSDISANISQAEANLKAAITKKAQAAAALQSARTSLQLTIQQTKIGLSNSQTAVDASKQSLQIMVKGARQQERQEAAENVKAAKANYRKAASDLARYEQLYKQQAISQQQLDAAQATAESAKAQYNSAVQAYSLIQAGNRPEQIRQAEIALQQSQENLKLAEANQSQVEVQRDNVTTAEAAVQAAIAGVDQARASLAVAEQAYKDAFVRSPINGVVAKRMVERGQQMGAGNPVMEIVALDSVYFEGLLSETEFSKVKRGQSVQVTVDALPGKTFFGTVARIYPVASSASRDFTLRIDIPNTTGELRPGMYARGRILVKRHPSAIVVSKDALTNIAGDTADLFVVRNGIAHLKQVKIGIVDPVNAEIRSGISVGEQVVVAGQTDLHNGDPIQIDR